MPRPLSRTETRRRPNRTTALIVTRSGRSVLPCLIAFSTSGCTRNGGTRADSAAGAMRRSISSDGPNRASSSARYASTWPQLVGEVDERAGPSQRRAAVVGEREHEAAGLVGPGPAEGGDRVQRVEQEVRLDLGLQRGQLGARRGVARARRARRPAARSRAGRRGSARSRDRGRRRSARPRRRGSPSRPRPTGSASGATTADRSGQSRPSQPWPQPTGRRATRRAAIAATAPGGAPVPAPWWSDARPAWASTVERSVTATAP